MSGRREDEIAQGLRSPDGALIGGLVVEDYNAGYCDAEAGNPPPRMPSASYDLGRALFFRRKEEAQQVKQWLNEQHRQQEARLREVLTPEQYAEYRKAVDASAPAGVDGEGGRRWRFAFVKTEQCGAQR